MGSDGAGKKDLLISHNKADRAWAEWMVWELEDLGYTVAVQSLEMRSGFDVSLEMDKAAAVAERIFILISPAYVPLLASHPEKVHPLFRDEPGRPAAVTALRVGKCAIKGLLGGAGLLDLVGRDEASARQALAAAAKRAGVEPAGAAPSRGTHRKPRFPAGLPPAVNLPRERLPEFIGREDLLAAIHSAFATGRSVALAQATDALGGFGKTQLALEYARRHVHDYAVVWWLRAENPVELAADYAALGRALELRVEHLPDMRQAVEMVRSRLSKQGGWLLVFDGAAGPETVQPYLPTGRLGHILVTSRQEKWQTLAETIEVPVLPREDAVRLLLSRQGGGGDGDEAAVVAEALADLPLALDLAAAFVAETHVSFGEYLDRFRGAQTQMPEGGLPGRKFDHVLAATVRVATDDLRRRWPASVGLLSLCAFLAPDGAPLDVIHRAGSQLPKPLAGATSERTAMAQTVAALCRYGLARGSDSDRAISMHAAVQTVVRDAMTDAERRTWAETAVTIINAAFPYDSVDSRTWPACARLLLHALDVGSYAERSRLAPQETGRLFNQVGLYLRGRGQLSEARGVIERALKIGEETAGDDHLSVAIRTNNLGTVLYDMGDLTAARALYIRALTIAEVVLSPDHPTVAKVANNLAFALRDEGDMEGARSNFQRALEIDEAAFGGRDRRVAVRLNNLGLVFRDTGDGVGARTTFERALKIAETGFGDDHPQVARVAYNLGRTWRDAGDPNLARALFGRALKILRRAFGEEHPSTQAVRKNLATLDETAAKK